MQGIGLSATKGFVPYVRSATIPTGSGTAESWGAVHVAGETGRRKVGVSSGYAENRV